MYSETKPEVPRQEKTPITQLLGPPTLGLGGRGGGKSKMRSVVSQVMRQPRIP